MREIKFRAWSKEAKAMYFPNNWKDLNIFPLTFGNDQIIVQQFTGLVDKNWNEIYEGDIIKQLQFTEYTGRIDRKIEELCSEVKYETLIDSHGIYISGFKVNSTSDIRKDCEIIGNIFENPELISTK